MKALAILSISYSLVAGAAFLAILVAMALLWFAGRSMRKQPDEPEVLAPEVEVSSNVIEFRRRHWPELDRRNIL